MEQLSKELGVTTFKLFMSQKGRLMLDNNEMMEAFKHIKDIGGVAKVSFGDSMTGKHKKHTCKKRGIAGIYPRNFFWIFRKILG